MQFVSAGSGFLSQHTKTLHFADAGYGEGEDHVAVWRGRHSRRDPAWLYI